MEFPSSVDCVIYGTGFAESILSSSLAVLGKHVLHLDRNAFYGGHLASLRFSDLSNLLIYPENFATTGSTNVTGSLMSIDLSSRFPVRLLQTSSHWYLIQDHHYRQPVPGEHVDQRSAVMECVDTNGEVLTITSSTNDSMADQAAGHGVSSTTGTNAVSSQVDTDVVECELGNTEEAASTPTTGDSVTGQAAATGGIDVTGTVGLLNLPETVVNWSRDELEHRLRRLDIDIMPKIIYSESPTTTVILRAGVHRYLDFLFVSRLLAHTVLPEECNNPDVTSGLESAQQSSEVNNPSVVQIPVGRSEMFKTRLLSLRQKRSLGVFFEWCTHLSTDGVTLRSDGRQPRDVGTPTNTELDADYLAFVDRPFHEFLAKQDKLDQFTRQLVLTNLVFGTEYISTRQAIERLRRLLFSMSRFGAYPLLWPMYGCGDLPQAFSRLSAVFGTTFCLNTSVMSIQRVEYEQGDGRSTNSPPSEDNQASITANRNFVIRLSNGLPVYASCVLIGADQVDADWLLPQVKRWCARAVLITDRSVYPEGRKPADVSLLALPLSGRGETVDPVFLVELPIDDLSVRNPSDRQLFLVHLTGTVTSPTNPETLLQPIVNRIFRPYVHSETTTAENEGTDIRPRLLWAGYFLLPDLSKVNTYLPGTRNSLLDDSNGVFLCPGLDTSLHLDNVVAATESLFYRLTAHLNINRPQDQSLTCTLSAVDGSSDHSDGYALPGTFVSLEARWDGLFPPRPPRQDEIVLHDLVPGHIQENEVLEPTIEGEASAEEQSQPTTSMEE